MMGIAVFLMAVLSIWDYPMRQPQHNRLRRQFVTAVREGDTETMRETCEKGVKLLPDDPTWRFNLACSLAYYSKTDAALDALEQAIDLGFRDDQAIANDTDLRRLKGNARFEELIEYAREMKTRPLITGPMASVDATGIFGKSITLGSQNLSWNFDLGCFEAHVKMAAASSGGNVGDLYMNRDAGHSRLSVTNFPGITSVQLDKEGQERKMDISYPNIRFPYPVFGNCSQAMTVGPFWRSLPRALMTTESSRLNMMVNFYLQNQIWVFPANVDCPPAGKHGDVFSSVAPYWFVSAGISWSDQPILRAALEASRSFRPDVKEMIVKRGLLSPTIQVLLRRSLRGVAGDAEYLSAAAHPTAIAGGAIDVARLKAAASEMTTAAIPPLAVLRVTQDDPKDKPLWPETTYGTAFAWAFVLRSADTNRTFTVSAKSEPDAEFTFAVVHDENRAARLLRKGADCATVLVDKTRMTPTNRVDVAVFARKPGTMWGAPSYVSFAVVDTLADYSDPALTPLGAPKDE